MKKAEHLTKERGRVMLQNTTVCNMGSVRYKTEIIGTELSPDFILTKGFKLAVQRLPQIFNEKAYIRFIESWGTVSYSCMKTLIQLNNN